MRLRLWLAVMLLASTTNAFAQDVDVENLARSERIQLAGCLSDTLKVVEKYQLVSLWRVLEAACAEEMERVQQSAENQLKDELWKKLIPGQLLLGMFEKASEIYKAKPSISCSETGCRLEEYRACLMRRIPAAIKIRSKPIDFENGARALCEDSESAARIALTNDFDNVLKRHLAHGINHRVNNLIGEITAGIRQAVVVLYGEDLIKVLPGRKSCKPEMCGASPCISLVEQPTEYQCVISQK